MSAATAAESPRRRGADLLLAHCAALDRRPVERRAEHRPAADRLQEALGGDLAGRLVSALASRQRERPRGLPV